MRRKIIQLFGGFLCVMLVFTFLSRAADGTSVARVTTRRTMSGFVNHTISGSGRVEALRERAVSHRGRSNRKDDLCGRGTDRRKGRPSV